MTVVVFGSANADLVFRVPALPAPGETVLGEGLPPLVGGKGVNQAIAAARDGARVLFAGCVGRDAMGATLRAALGAEGVDVSRLVEVDAPTGLAAICVDAEGRNQIAVSSGANRLARASQVEDAALSGGATLLLQMETPPDEVAALVLRARRLGARVVLNLAPAGPLDPAALRAASLLVLNEREAAWLGARLGRAGEAGPLRDALGSPEVAVTLGERGAEAATGEGALRVPAFAAAEVRDTTGAGDAWCGVLAAALDRGAPLPAAMRRASAAAALACARPGAHAPARAETDALLAG